MNAPAAEITVLRNDAFACAQIVGRGNVECCPGLERALDELLAASLPRLVIALKDCKAVDSSFVGLLNSCALRFQRGRRPGEKLELFNACDGVRRSFALLDVADNFVWRDDMLEIPPNVTAKRLDLTTTRMALRIVSLKAHEHLASQSPANQARFATVIPTMRESVARQMSGEPPDLPGFDIAARTEQLGTCGGDFYDFALRAGLQAALLVADACGHGEAAEPLAAIGRPILREELAIEQPPSVMFKHSLLRVAPLLPKSKFVAALCVLLNGATHTFRVARAGAEPLAWFHAKTGAVDFLQPKGMALGFSNNLEDATFLEREALMEPGDVLLLFTDGINEAADPEGHQWGHDGIARQLKASARLDARAIVENVFSAVEEFSQHAPPTDDRTLVVVKAQ